MTEKRRVDTSETVGARIPLREMVVDEEYQGHVSHRLVDKIAATWNEAASGAIILNMRNDNTYAVLDGQHRVLAAQRCGVADLNALVFIGKTRQEEAALFVQLNTKHNVRPFDRFKANLLAGKTEEKNIKHILQELGLQVTGNPRAKGGVRCIVDLLNIYRNFGPAHLKLVMGILQSAFAAYPDVHKAYAAEAVMGISQFLHRYPEANIDRLLTKLKATSPTTVKGIGDTKIDPGQSSWIGWGKAITGLYNAGFRTTYSGYLPPERWNRSKYTPAGKAKVSNNSKILIKKVNKNNAYQFKAGVPYKEQLAIKRAAKTGK